MTRSIVDAVRVHLCATAVVLVAAVYPEVSAATPLESILAAVQQNSEPTAGTDNAIPAELARLAQVDSTSGPRDRVLNQMRAGVVAFELGRYDFALPILKDAFDQIETIYANDPVAKKARSVFTPDATKEFKGDAYERAMVGYYLGLSYLAKGELDNARASFKWGEFQDTMSAAEVYQADMASLRYLQGWVAQCQGEVNTAGEHFESARKIRGALAIPDAKDNVLVISEIGGGPIKVGSGKFNEYLSFQSGKPTAIQEVTVEAGSQTATLNVAEDVDFQASTLGGRAVDKILAGKASFKQGAQTTADVTGGVAQVGLAVANQAALSGNYDTASSALGVSAVSSLFSIGAQIMANKAKPAADIRYWDNLPGRMLFATLSGGAASKLAIHYRDGNAVELQSRALVPRKTGNCYLAWDRDKSVGNPMSNAPVNSFASPAVTVPASRFESVRDLTAPKKQSGGNTADVIPVF